MALKVLFHFLLLAVNIGLSNNFMTSSPPAILISVTLGYRWEEGKRHQDGCQILKSEKDKNEYIEYSSQEYSKSSMSSHASAAPAALCVAVMANCVLICWAFFICCH